MKVMKSVFTIGLLLGIVPSSTTYAAMVSECSYKGFAGDYLIRAKIEVRNSDATVQTIVKVGEKDYTQQSDYHVVRNTEQGLYLVRVQENLPNSRFDYRAMAVIIIDKRNGVMTMANIFANGPVERTSGVCNTSK